MISIIKTTSVIEHLRIVQGSSFALGLALTLRDTNVDFEGDFVVAKELKGHFHILDIDCNMTDNEVFARKYQRFPP